MLGGTTVVQLNHGVIGFRTSMDTTGVSQVAKSSPANAGDGGPILGLGRSPGEGNGNLPQCSCLENFMGRRAWQAAIHGIRKSHKVCSQLSN